MNTLSSILLGIVIGLIIATILTLLLVRNKINNTSIKGKVKQKRTSGSNLDVTNTITKKEERKQKKALRKQNKN